MKINMWHVHYQSLCEFCSEEKQEVCWLHFFLYNATLRSEEICSYTPLIFQNHITLSLFNTWTLTFLPSCFIFPELSLTIFLLFIEIRNMLFHI